MCGCFPVVHKKKNLLFLFSIFFLYSYSFASESSTQLASDQQNIRVDTVAAIHMMGDAVIVSYDKNFNEYIAARQQVDRNISIQREGDKIKITQKYDENKNSEWIAKFLETKKYKSKYSQAVVKKNEPSSRSLFVVLNGGSGEEDDLLHRAMVRDYLSVVYNEKSKTADAQLNRKKYEHPVLLGIFYKKHSDFLKSTPNTHHYSRLFFLRPPPTL